MCVRAGVAVYSICIVYEQVNEKVYIAYRAADM